MNPLGWLKKFKHFFTGGVDINKARSKLNKATQTNKQNVNSKGTKDASNAHQYTPKSYGLFPTGAIEETEKEGSKKSSKYSLTNFIKKTFNKSSNKLSTNNPPNNKKNKKTRSIS